MIENCSCQQQLGVIFAPIFNKKMKQTETSPRTWLEINFLDIVSRENKDDSKEIRLPCFVAFPEKKSEHDETNACLVLGNIAIEHDHSNGKVKVSKWNGNEVDYVILTMGEFTTQYSVQQTLQSLAVICTEWNTHFSSTSLNKNYLVKILLQSFDLWNTPENKVFCVLVERLCQGKNLMLFFATEKPQQGQSFNIGNQELEEEFNLKDTSILSCLRQ